MRVEKNIVSIFENLESQLFVEDCSIMIDYVTVIYNKVNEEQLKNVEIKRNKFTENVDDILHDHLADRNRHFDGYHHDYYFHRDFLDNNEKYDQDVNNCNTLNYYD